MWQWWTGSIEYGGNIQDGAIEYTNIIGDAIIGGIKIIEYIGDIEFIEVLKHIENIEVIEYTKSSGGRRYDVSTSVTSNFKDNGVIKDNGDNMIEKTEPFEFVQEEDMEFENLDNPRGSMGMAEWDLEQDEMEQQMNEEIRLLSHDIFADKKNLLEELTFNHE